MIRPVWLIVPCLGWALIAHAEERLTISTRGFDLDTTAGARAFYSRLSQAVAAACGGAPTVFLGSEEQRFEDCYKPAMDQAVAQASSPRLAALHLAKQRHTITMATR